MWTSQTKYSFNNVMFSLTHFVLHPWKFKLKIQTRCVSWNFNRSTIDLFGISPTLSQNSNQIICLSFFAFPQYFYLLMETYEM